MFRGLCAFPLTPVTAQDIDEMGIVKTLSRIIKARSVSLGILGQPGVMPTLTTYAREHSAVLPIVKAWAPSILSRFCSMSRMYCLPFYRLLLVAPITCLSTSVVDVSATQGSPWSMLGINSARAEISSTHIRRR